MINWTYIGCSLAAAVLICLFSNPLGLGWASWADLSGAGWYAVISWLTLALIGLPLVIFFVIGGWFVLKNFGRALGFSVLLMAIVFAGIMQVEAKGAAILSNLTILYFIVVFGVCLAIGSAMALSEVKPKK